MNKKLVALLSVFTMGVLLGGCSLTDKTMSGPKMESDFEVQSQVEVNGQKSDDVDQKQLENAQKVDTKKDDIDTIERDIDSTVILKEDFSDL